MTDRFAEDIGPLEDPGVVIALPIGMRSGIPDAMLRYELVLNERSAGFFIEKDDAHRYASRIGWASYSVVSHIALQPCEKCKRVATLDALRESHFRYDTILCAQCMPLHRTAIINTTVEKILALPDVDSELTRAKVWFEQLENDFGPTLEQLGQVESREGVYALEFLLDDGSRAVYVGQSECMSRRIGDHLRAIIGVYYGANRPSATALWREVSEEHLARANTERVPDMLDGIRREIMRRYPYAGYLRTTDSQEWFWENQVATDVAALLGPRVRVRVLEHCKIEHLLKREAHWQHSINKPDVLPLWVANTRSSLSGARRRSY